ncbi:MAG TPA: GNAT family protein [Bryobacteraceae bacterium]|nr:GNAT family protein [Bryobacteraceae bacterium]
MRYDLGRERLDSTRVQSVFQDIVTDRLILRDLGPVDAEFMLLYRSNPEVSRYQNWEPASVDQLRSYFEELTGMDPDTAGAWYQLGIVLRSGGGLIGDCGIHILDDPRQAEIGITVARRFQCRGYATEALRAIVGYLFGKLRKHRISASIDPRNTGSIRLMQRLGFRQEAHMIGSLWFKGQWVDDVVFAILAEEWAGEQQSRKNDPTPLAVRGSVDTS